MCFFSIRLYLFKLTFACRRVIKPPKKHITARTLLAAVMINNAVLIMLIIVGAYFFIPVVGQQNTLYPFHLQSLQVQASQLSSPSASQPFQISGGSSMHLSAQGAITMTSEQRVNLTAASSVHVTSGTNSDIVLTAPGMCSSASCIIALCLLFISTSLS